MFVLLPIFILPMTQEKIKEGIYLVMKCLTTKKRKNNTPNQLSKRKFRGFLGNRIYVQKKIIEYG